MTTVDAHLMFATMSDREPVWVTSDVGHRLTIDFGPAIDTAKASLSGWLDDCENLDDLLEAADQGERLLSCGVLRKRHLSRELEVVVAALEDDDQGDDGEGDDGEGEAVGGAVLIRGRVRSGVFFLRRCGLPIGHLLAPDGPARRWVFSRGPRI